jgi:hypothetical protein
MMLRWESQLRGGQSKENEIPLAVQNPEEFAKLYSEQHDDDDDDQTRKWQDLLDNTTIFQGKEGADLLKAMELEVDESDGEDIIAEEQMELDSETVRIL